MAGQIVVEIVGDARKFTSATQEATKSGDGMAGAMKKVAAGAAILGGAVVAGGVAVFELGSKFEAMDAKAQTVFGDSLADVQEWAKQSAAAMGLTSREAIGLATDMGDLLVPMGFTRDQAASMSTDILGLSGALSEWTGGTKSSAEVSEVLTKALLGERDGLKALGISITEADVQRQLLANGTAELTGAELEQAKALATQQLIMAKTQDAQTAYAEGTAKGIRTQNEMNAKLKEVGETLVTALYPAVSTVAGFLADNLSPALAFAGDVFDTVRQIVEPIAQVVFPILGAAIGKAGEVVRALLPVVRTVFGTIASIIKGVVDTISSLFGIAGGVVNTLAGVFRGLGDAIGRVFSSIGGIIKGAINGVIRIVNGVIRAINGIQVHIEVGPVSLHWNGLNLRQIPTLHQGGVVPGAPGTEVLSLLQAGETVTPIGGKGGRELVVNIYGPVYGDTIDDLTRRIAARLQYAG